MRYPLDSILGHRVLQAVSRLEVLYASFVTVNALHEGKRNDVSYLKPDLPATVVISSADLR